MHPAIITPGITRKQFIAAAAGEHHLDELAGETGGVIVRIALSNAQVFEMPDQLREDMLHVSRVHHYLVVLSLKDVGHQFSRRSLVKIQFETGGRRQIKSAGKCMEAWDV